MSEQAEETWDPEILLGVTIVPEGRGTVRTIGIGLSPVATVLVEADLADQVTQDGRDVLEVKVLTGGAVHNLEALTELLEAIVYGLKQGERVGEGE